MLKNIPSVLTPDLLKILMEMGHGDELVIADGNFPSASHAQCLVRCDGHGVPEILEAVLTFLPLDQYVQKPAALMEKIPGDTTKTVIWDEYDRIVKEHDSLTNGFDFVERFAFYERTKHAYAVIATGETALYANIILKKGVVSG